MQHTNKSLNYPSVFHVKQRFTRIYSSNMNQVLRTRSEDEKFMSESCSNYINEVKAPSLKHLNNWIISNCVVKGLSWVMYTSIKTNGFKKTQTKGVGFVILCSLNLQRLCSMPVSFNRFNMTCKQLKDQNPKASMQVTT